MPLPIPRIGLPCALAALLGASTLLAGCAAPQEKLTAPQVTSAPYDTARGEVLWAVVPLRNETGTSLVSSGDISDKLVAAVEEVQGVRTVPLNRTIQAMNALGMQYLSTPADARKLAQAMAVDAIVVGSITAYDPYTPELGIALAVYPRPGAMAHTTAPLDPRALAARPADTAPGQWPREDGPLATVSEHLDAKNHQVQMDIKAFAEGRLKGPSALGWRRYMASMDLYCEFAAHHAVAGLMRQEWARLPGGGGL